MNYKKIYDDLISSRMARNPITDEYTELHHIIPRCMNGTDEKHNLIELTLREHYFAHYLLSKIYPDHSIAQSWWLMATRLRKYGYTISSRSYEKSREIAIKSISKSLTGRKLTDEHKKNIKNNISRHGVMKGYENGIGKINLLPRSEEWKHKISESNKGKPKSEDHKLALRLAAKTRKKTPQVHTQETCRYCGKTTRKSAITRYHNENCKEKK